MNFQLPSDPHLRRWMAFVDGENFTCRAQEVAKNRGISLAKCDIYHPGVFVWIPNRSARDFVFTDPPIRLQAKAVRSHYYTSCVGDEPKLSETRDALWKLGFQPEVLKRDKSTIRSKGVDILLAKDFLSNAFYGNYDVAVLYAGDGDYVPMVNEVKRMGKVVYVVSFYESGLNPALRLASDECFGIDAFFCSQWEKFKSCRPTMDGLGPTINTPPSHGDTI